MELLAALFGPHAAVLRWRVDVGLTLDHPVAAAEEAVVARAVAKRRREFRSGRHLAHAVLRDLETPAAAIPKGAAGMPVWPEGVVGSIAHCDDLAVAVAGRRGRLAGVGVDVEGAEPLDPALDRIILGPAQHRHAVLWPKTVFCAKEAFYKAVYPSVGRVLDFADAAVHPRDDPAAPAGRFTVVPAPGLRRDGLPAVLEGRWLRWGGRLFCFVALVTPESSGAAREE